MIGEFSQGNGHENRSIRYPSWNSSSGSINRGRVVVKSKLMVAGAYERSYVMVEQKKARGAS
jgi:hypothetical protein